MISIEFVSPINCRAQLWLDRIPQSSVVSCHMAVTSILKEGSLSAEANKSHDRDLPEISLSVAQEPLRAQEHIMKSFLESVVVSITSWMADLVEDVADLQASLQFSQQDISSHEEKIK